MKQIVQLSKLAANTFGATQVQQPAAWGLKNALREQMKEWTPLKDANKEQLMKNRKALEDLFTGDAYAQAWLANQFGDREKAKATLETLFNQEHKRVMALQKAVVVFGVGPLAQAESLHHALSQISNESEKKSQAALMQQMQLHVSKLPESQYCDLVH